MSEVMCLPLAVVNATARMSLVARAGFLLLLAEQWESADGYLPADDEALCGIAGLSRDEWEASRAQIHVRLTMVAGKCCEPGLREQWEAESRLSEARAAAARGTNLGRWGNGERPKATAKRSRAAAEPAVSVGTTDVVEEGLRDKSKGSVMREGERTDESGGKKDEAISENPQLPGEERDTTEAGSEATEAAATFRSVSQLPRNLISAPCHGNREIYEPVVGPSCAAYPEFARSEPQDDFRGATVPPASHGSLLGPPVSPESAFFDPSDPEIHASDEIETLRAAAVWTPASRLRGRIAR